MRNWSRNDAIAINSLLVGVIACLATLIMVPEVRKAMGLERPPAAGQPSDPQASPPTGTVEAAPLQSAPAATGPSTARPASAQVSQPAAIPQTESGTGAAPDDAGDRDTPAEAVETPAPERTPDPEEALREEAARRAARENPVRARDRDESLQRSAGREGPDPESPRLRQPRFLPPLRGSWICGARFPGADAAGLIPIAPAGLRHAGKQRSGVKFKELSELDHAQPAHQRPSIQPFAIGSGEGFRDTARGLARAGGPGGASGGDGAVPGCEAATGRAAGA